METAEIVRNDLRLLGKKRKSGETLTHEEWESIPFPTRDALKSSGLVKVVNAVSGSGDDGSLAARINQLEDMVLNMTQSIADLNANNDLLLISLDDIKASGSRGRTPNAVKDLIERVEKLESKGE